MPPDPQPVLILGAGINGSALARELVLNRVPVCLVDTADMASGATSASSRLIHGGLRYLEYGEFDLVRESLGERTRLLRLAPQFVRPLELFIPLRTRFSGFPVAARRFLGLKPAAKPAKTRGLWLVRAGLRLYDAYAKDPVLPRHRVLASGGPGSLPLDPQRFRWQCSFYDAQVLYPERFVLALLEDARQIAQQTGVAFEVFTHHRARIEGQRAEIVPQGSTATARSLTPSAVVNATGAWVDWTLRDLAVRSKRLIGGTKGSHFLTAHAGLRERLGGRGVYAEAVDGRPFFILPLREQSLVGTTDVAFEGDPAEAVASPEELDYLLQSANGVFPDLNLQEDDINWHYCGVRPLPFSESATTAAITRRHWLEENVGGPLPCYSVIGGKLTTCRSLAEEAADTLLARLGLTRIGNSRDRPVPGGANYPADPGEVQQAQQLLADRLGFSPEQVASVWALCGTRSEAILVEAEGEERENLDGTQLPRAFARWAIEREWVSTLDDLVERRLMLLYQPRLTRRCLRQLADDLAAAGRLPEPEAETAIDRTVARVLKRHGKHVETS